jgi:predicted cation transporter
MHHQMGVMMGQMGLTLTEWEETLTSPMGETVLIAIFVALLAAYFFRVAWVLDQEEQN